MNNDIGEDKGRERTNLGDRASRETRRAQAPSSLLHLPCHDDIGGLFGYAKSPASFSILGALGAFLDLSITRSADDNNLNGCLINMMTRCCETLSLQ